MADRTKELLVPPQNAREICSTLNRVFFHEYNFRAAGKDFSNPENSFLHKVIARKKGLPITLCVLYLLVSRRIGFDLEPIGIPGRFMLGCFSEKIPFYIDIWSGGKFYEVEQMESFLGNFSSDESGSYLLPVTVGETLTRGCRNLVQQYIKSGDSKNLNCFKVLLMNLKKFIVKKQMHEPSNKVKRCKTTFTKSGWISCIRISNKSFHKSSTS